MKERLPSILEALRGAHDLADALRVLPSDAKPTLQAGFEELRQRAEDIAHMCKPPVPMDDLMMRQMIDQGMFK